jgi:protocatechuate 3,4-dioxygenase beta subunit
MASLPGGSSVTVYRQQEVMQDLLDAADTRGVQIIWNAVGHASPGGVPRGEPIEITGRVLDGKGEIVADAIVEIRQTNTAGPMSARR